MASKLLERLRTIWFWAGFAPLTTFFTLVSMIQYRIGKETLASSSAKRWSRWLLWLAGARIRVDLSALNPEQNYVFMPNHLSQMDIFSLYSALRQWRVAFVAKESLFKIPVLGHGMRRTGNLPIDRDNPRKAMRAIAFAQQRVQEGWSPIIFPEGTRSRDYSKLQEFQIGGMVLALKCGVPVAPVIIQGSERILPKGSYRFRGGKTVIRIKALPPVDVSRYDLKDREQLRDDMYQIMNKAFLETKHG